MILGTKARYAVMAMVDLAINSHENPIKLSDIASRQEMPVAYLEQIFARLKQNGIVTSVKGPGGGYLLSRNMQDLPISEIITAAEEDIKMTRCDSHAKGGCMATKAQCLTHDLWEGLGSKIYEYFYNISLADVCKRNIKQK